MTRFTASATKTLQIDDSWRISLPLLVLPRRFHDHQPRGVQVDLGVGDHPLNRLMLGELLAERIALFRARDGDLERALRDAEPAHAVREPRGREADLRHAEAVADFAEDRGVGNADVRVFDLAMSAEAVAAHRRHGAHEAIAGRVGGDEEHRRRDDATARRDR